MSPIHTRRSRLMPSHRYSCMFRCTVYAPVSQMRFRRSSLQRNDPRRGISRICKTARTWLRDTGTFGSTASIRTNRNPLGPMVVFPSQGSATVWSRTAWSFCAPRSPSSAIASLTDSPKRTRTRRGSFPGVMGVKISMLPLISVPKSSDDACGLILRGAEHARWLRILQYGLAGFRLQQTGGVFDARITLPDDARGRDEP